MRIEHIALWCSNLERTRQFYEQYFQAVAGAKYANPRKSFESYFLTFDGGARLEIMQMPGIAPRAALPPAQSLGYAHIAISVGSEAEVDALTERLRQGGYPALDGPRRTGDGYYESVVLDPDGNRVEITV